MKNLLFICALLVSLTGYAQWTYTTLSQPKADIDAVSIGNKVIFHSGGIVKNNENTDSDTTEIWDLEKGTKEIKVLTGRPVRHRAITTIGSKVFFAGGSTTITTSNQVDIYDTLTNTWTRTSLSLDRKGVAAVSSNEKAYFAGGWNGATKKLSYIVDVYDVNTTTWSTKELEYLNPVLVTSQREFISAVTIGNKILFAGGNYQGIPFTNLVNIYNTETNQWMPNITSLSQKKTKMKNIVYHNKVYFVGGSADINYISIPSDTIDIYDNNTDSWSVMKIPHLMKDNNTSNPIRPYLQAVQAGCKMFLVPSPSSPTNGDNFKKEMPDTIAVYDFARDIWSYMPLPNPRTYVTAVASGNKVIFAGGKTMRWFSFLNDVDILTLSPKLQTVAGADITTSYTFDKTKINEEKTVTIHLSNEGDYDLLFNANTKLELSGINEADFHLQPISIKDTLLPAQIISINITFKPQTIGDKSATLTIYSNDPENPVYAFLLKGTADDEVTAINDHLITQSVSIYPNPADNFINVKINKSFSLASLTLRDISGKIQRQINTVSADNSLQTIDLAEGFYLLEVNVDGNISTEKIIISH